MYVQALPLRLPRSPHSASCAGPDQQGLEVINRLRNFLFRSACLIRAAPPSGTRPSLSSHSWIEWLGSLFSKLLDYVADTS